MTNVEISKDKCTVCGLCAKICPVGIFKKEDDEIVIIEKLIGRVCMECGQCVAVCPNKAVSLDGIGGIQEEKYDKEVLKKQLPLLIRQRRSVRIYQNKPVTYDDIKPILDTVRYSPSAKNTQCVSYTLLTGKSLEDFIKYCYDNIGIIGLDNFKDAFYNKNKDVLFRHAPAVLIAHAPAERHISLTDCTIALTLFDILAPLYNLGTCWGGYIMNLSKHDENMKKYLELKEGNEIYGVLLLGHAGVKYTSTPQRKPADIEIRK